MNQNCNHDPFSTSYLMNFGIEGTDDNLICLIRSCRQFGGVALPFGTDIVLGVDP